MNRRFFFWYWFSLLLQLFISTFLFLTSTVPVTCGGYVDSLEQSSFSTPGYPNGYSPLARCRWTIHVPEDYYMKLTIDVDIEDTYMCQYDYLNVNIWKKIFYLIVIVSFFFSFSREFSTDVIIIQKGRKISKEDTIPAIGAPKRFSLIASK